MVVASVTGGAVRKLRLRARPEPGTHVAIGSSGQLPDEIRGDVVWPVTIWKDEDGEASSRIIFEADYESGERNTAETGVADVALDLNVKQRPKNEEIASVTIQASFEKLEERRPQQLFVVVANLTDVPLTIGEVSVNLPSFAKVWIDGRDALATGGRTTVYAASQGRGLVIPSRQQHVFELGLAIPQYTPVLAGKYLMMIEVKLHYVKDGYSTESSILTTKDFQAGVLGEQEFVGITSAPFLLLPGFLVVAVLSLLMSKVWPKGSFKLDYRQPEFYLIGVVVSMVILFWLFGWMNGLLYQYLWRVGIGQLEKAGHDPFAGYSVEDIVNIWVISILLALAPWTLIGGVVRLVAVTRVRLQRAKTPTTDDQPLDVLLRLERANKPFELKQAIVEGERLWELPLPSPDPTKKWVAGGISVSAKDLNTTGDDKARKTADEAVSRFRGLFRDLINEPTRTKKLYELLYQERNYITTAWEPKNQKPRLVEKKDAPTWTGAPEDFVRDG